MKVLMSKKGEGYITACVLIIVMSMLFAVTFTYAASLSKVKMMRENTKVVLDSFVTQNATQIYDSIKQGNDYTEAINADDFYTSLISFCTLESRNGKLYSLDASGNEQLYITDLELSFRDENELELVVEYTVNTLLSFAGKQFAAASVPVEITSALTEKF